MLKINLSDEQDNTRKRDESAEETSGTEKSAETKTGAFKETADTVSKPAGSRINLTRTLVLLAILAVVAVIYIKKDRIFGLFAGREEPVELIPPPPPPKKEPEPVPEPKEPDPTFVVLNSLGEVVPPKIWLSSVVVMYDGSYEIKGMAFAHDAIGVFLSSLGNIGAVTSENVPAKSKQSDAVYLFSAAGKLQNIKVPEILDLIPADRLQPLAENVTAKSDDYGVLFISLPKSGKVYTDKDMPFSLEGSFSGLRKVVADLCPEGGSTKIYRLVIASAAPGRMFDKVRASFALRTVSAI